jgi:deoxycytidine triphosphate deaminase
LLEVSPRRYWKKVVLQENQSITIKPGELLLARVYEKFTIPNKCAAKISGKSSYARIGLLIHCTGDYGNPGYRGHWPLQLVNLSPNPIRIFPYISIGQMMLIKLSSTPENLYSKNPHAKYHDDDGGPSFWWRDKQIKNIQKTFEQSDLSLAMQHEIIDIIGIQEPEVIERLDEYIQKSPIANLTNTDFLLDSFSKKEDKKKNFDNLKKNLLTSIFPLFLSISLGSLLSDVNLIWSSIFWVITILSAPVSYIGFKIKIGEYLDSERLQMHYIQLGKKTNS